MKDGIDLVPRILKVRANGRRVRDDLGPTQGKDLMWKCYHADAQPPSFNVAL